MSDLWRGPFKAVRARPLCGLVRTWTTAAQDWRMNDLMALYASEAVLHTPARDWCGLRDVRIGLLDSGALGEGWERAPHWSGKLLVVRRAGAGRSSWLTWLRVQHGEIVEQWLKIVPPPLVPFVEGRPRVVE